MTRTRPYLLRRRDFAGAFAVLIAAMGVAPASASDPAQLQRRLSAARAHERALQSSIHSDTRRINRVQARIDDVRARLNALQASLDVEHAELVKIEGELRAARGRLAFLQLQLAHDEQVLAEQLVAGYEAPQPDIVTVVLRSKGFADLLERVDALKRVSRRNAQTVVQVRAERLAVAAQATRLADVERRQRAVTIAARVQRNEVAQLRLALVSRQHLYAGARRRKAARLRVLQARGRRLERQLAKFRVAFGGVPGGARYSGGGFGPHGGEFGFFPAAGTNYSVGSEPQIAARLDALGRALHLHLIGISGYRSPQHSVEVGGFANDPHTRGEASDTPGIEGVPEATLERFGLTRPFGGAAEADHIQLLGSAR
jgi:peptidoglycan hydrolase CwlO-like protein